MSCDGVALAGVQALDKRTLDDHAKIDALQKENQDLKARLIAIEARLNGR